MAYKRSRFIRNIVFTLLVLMIAIIALIEIKIYQLNGKALSQTYTQMLVLGAKVRPDGPSLSLISRLDLALEIYKLNPEIRIVVSGGQGADEPVSEAGAMADYLIARGVEKNKLSLEGKSSNTYENVIFSKPLINPSNPLLIVTNDYHVIRACLLAKEMGLNGYCAGANTPSHVWLKLRLREYVAIVSFWIGSVI